MKHKKIFLVATVFLLLLQSVFAATTVYWLRGTDLSAQIEGGTYSFLSSTAPTASSSKTLKKFTEQKGIGELTRWYSLPFPSDFLLSGTIYFWASDFELKSGKAQYRLSLFEFDLQNQQSTLIAQSDWFDFTSKVQEAQLQIPASRMVKSGNSLKLVLEHNTTTANSVTELLLDEPQPFQQTTWAAPIGTTISAFGVKNTAAILAQTCSTASIACSNNSDCDDGIELTTDVCEQPETCNAKCSYSQCNTQCVTNAQCTDSNHLTTDQCSAIGECNATCSNIECTIKCNSNADCNDQNNSTQDQCVFSGTCLSFCENKPCAQENCSAQETSECGNELCEFRENCPKDCPANNIELLGVSEGEYFLFGVPVKVTAKITGSASSVTMNGFFGEKPLLDDGIEPDQKANDKIFSGEFTPEYPEKGNIKITVNAGQESLVKYYTIAPVLDVGIKTDRQNYFSGDEIIVTAFANRLDESISSDMNFSIQNNGKIISSKSVPKNRNNLYVYRYKISSLDQEGEIKITAGAQDEFKNTGAKSKTVLLSKGSEVVKGLRIELLNFPTDTNKNQRKLVELTVKEPDGKTTENAEVKITLPGGQITNMEQTGRGIYFGFIEFKDTDPAGEQPVTITAQKTIDSQKLRAELVKKILVAPSKLELEITGINGNKILLGQETIITVKGIINQKTFQISDAIIFVNKKPLDTETRDGEVTSKILVSEEADFPLQLNIQATDFYGNTGTTEIYLESGGISPIYFIQKNFVFLLVFLLLILGAVLFFGLQLASKTRQETLKKQEKQIIKEFAVLQKKYFKGGFLQRKDYDAAVLKLENELKEIRECLGEKEK